jgi:hypothetical protein
MGRKAGPMRHGTMSGYTNRRCRCSDCRAAMRAYYKERKQRLNSCQCEACQKVRRELLAPPEETRVG